MSLRRSFFFTTAERKPLTEWACQAEAFISSSSEAPFGRSRRVRRASVFDTLSRLDAFTRLLRATFLPEGDRDLVFSLEDAALTAAASATSAARASAAFMPSGTSRPRTSKARGVIL